MNTLYQSLVAVEPATLIAVICNLFIQMYVVKKFFLNKVLAVLDKRRQAADEQMEQAQAARAEALAIKESHEESVRRAKDEASHILAQAQKNAVARSEEIISQARAQAAQMKEKASSDIALERKNAMNGAKDEITGIAMAIAEKVVEREVSCEDQEKLISSFIDSLGDAL